MVAPTCQPTTCLLAMSRKAHRQAQWLFNEMENNLQANVQLSCATECTLYPVVPVAGPENAGAQNRALHLRPFPRPSRAVIRNLGLLTYGCWLSN